MEVILRIFLTASMLGLSITGFAYQLPEDGSSCIPKEYLYHSFLNKELIEIVKELNEKYKDEDFAQSSSLRVSIEKFSNDEIVYGITYLAAINRKTPVILMEPIDGKDVVLTLDFLINEINIDPLTKRIHLLKDYAPDEFETHYENLQECILENIDPPISWVIVLGNLPYWTVIFDKSGNILSRDYGTYL